MMLKTGEEKYKESKTLIKAKFAWLPTWVGGSYERFYHKDALIWLTDYIVVKEVGKKDGKYYPW